MESQTPIDIIWNCHFLKTRKVIDYQISKPKSVCV